LFCSNCKRCPGVSVYFTEDWFHNKLGLFYHYTQQYFPQKQFFS
jgi:hypothetical protein